MMAENFSIHYAAAGDIAQLAAVHKAAFPKSYSTLLGAAYRQKMLEWFLVSNRTFLFYAKNEAGEVVGYLGGITRDSAMKTGSSSAMVQYSFNAALKGLMLHPWLLFHPEVLKKYRFLAQNILQKIMGKKPSAPKTYVAAYDKQVGLIVIGVKPAYFGKGVSTVLMREFERKALELGIPNLYLSVNPNNTRAVKAYEKNGWYFAFPINDNVIMHKILN